ncbi:hypothetical protein RIF23_03875 [Lipingzhangella sp. LS1_29]|uniref:Uncharacterized protein n=1 Tax=Lipingzhangella rawalii TaxID=2055835 RepID=A0ABU2H2A9_9ACTN|nr:hypothetical protein [Lipingzhangella rawalii]MDS1269431.1 hypothetical protein [Lipingzhangella rawalii]
MGEVHLCFGDLNHEALWHARDTGPVVEIAQKVVQAWPRGRTLDYLHLPLATGTRPAVPNARALLPLTRLRGLSGNTRLVAGLVHEDQHLDMQRVTLRLVEVALGRRVDVAASCGLGHRSPAAAERSLRTAAALAYAHT